MQAAFYSWRSGLYTKPGLNSRCGGGRSSGPPLSVADLIFHFRRPGAFGLTSGCCRLGFSFEDFLPLPVGTEFGAGVELGFQPVGSAAVWTYGIPQGDPFCGFDVFGHCRFSLTKVQSIRGPDAHDHSLSFSGFLGHPAEGAGDFGGRSGRFLRLVLLPVEFGDPGVEFGAAPMSAAA
jgi:hypothetical protein